MLLLFCAATGLLLIISYLILYMVLVQTFRSAFDRHLVEAATGLEKSLSTEVASPDDLAEVGVPGYFFELLDDQGQLRVVSKDSYKRPLRPKTDWPANQPANLWTINDLPEHGRLRAVSVRLDAKLANWVLVLAVPTKETDEALLRFKRLILALFASNLALVAIMSWWYVRRSLLPLSDLTERISRMARQLHNRRFQQVHLVETFGTQLPVRNSGDELGHLTEAFNQLFNTLTAVLQQLQQFVADASHELRTPLSILRGETELLLQRPRSVKDYEKAIRVIDTELRNLGRIVEGMFTLSMADAGRLCIARDRVSLNEVLSEACELVGQRARAKSVDIDQKQSEEVFIAGDEALLRELFLIFLDNALKYSPAHTTVQITLEKVDHMAIVGFADQGVGIPSQHLPHIFERFYRVPMPIEADTHSGGLGLAIAKAIAEAHGGCIECTSVVGRGSHFRICFSPDMPLPASAEQERASFPPKHHGSPPAHFCP